MVGKEGGLVEPLKEGEDRQKVDEVKGYGKKCAAAVSNHEEGKKHHNVSFLQHEILPTYVTLPEYRSWARAGMVATLISGDSLLATQQCVEDFGFTSVVCTLMGTDKAFFLFYQKRRYLACVNSAINFFSMLFGNVHKWTTTDECYEWGAWIRVYGTPAQAWKEAFFKICVLGCGRFLRADACTVDKERLDYEHVLVSTPCLEVVNMCPDILIDGFTYSINLVEEWVVIWERIVFHLRRI